MKPRPKILPGDTYQIKTGCGNLYLTVNLENDKPREVFIGMGQAGGCFRVVTEAVARLISLWLQSGQPVDEVVKKLSMLSCDHQVPFPKDTQNLSCIDAAARVLSKYKGGDEDQANIIAKSIPSDDSAVVCESDVG